MKHISLLYSFTFIENKCNIHTNLTQRFFGPKTLEKPQRVNQWERVIFYLLLANLLQQLMSKHSKLISQNSLRIPWEMRKLLLGVCARQFLVFCANSSWFLCKTHSEINAKLSSIRPLKHVPNWLESHALLPVFVCCNSSSDSRNYFLSDSKNTMPDPSKCVLYQIALNDYENLFNFRPNLPRKLCQCSEK